MFQLSDTFLYDMLVGDVLVVLKNLIISTKKESSKSQPVFQYGKKFVEPLGKNFNCFQKGFRSRIFVPIVEKFDPEATVLVMVILKNFLLFL